MVYHFFNFFYPLPPRMENSVADPPSLPDRVAGQTAATSGQLSDSARSSRRRGHLDKSPRRRRKATGSRRRRAGDGQLLSEIERRRLPGQREHLEASGSASDTAESSPKRFALQGDSWSSVPLPRLCCPGLDVVTS